MAWAAINPIPIYAVERVAQLVADDLGVDVEVTKLGGTRWHLVDSCGTDLAHIERVHQTVEIHFTGVGATRLTQVHA
jgi:hypothetical protein